MRKNAKKYIIIKCHHCGQEVSKQKKEYDRLVLKRGQVKFYCNNSCSYNDNLIVQERSQYAKEHPQEMYSRMLSGCNGVNPNQDNEFSSFRYFINKSKAKERVKNYGISNLTVEYLKKLWEAQNGICPYTKIKMELPKNTQDYHIRGKPHKASLDRIDSDKGYIEGNVEFVCLSVNYAKNGFSKRDMIDFFSKISSSVR